MDDEDIKDNIEILMKSVGVKDSNGDYTCPFCNSYADSPEHIKHTGSCFIHKLGDIVKETNTINESAEINIQCAIDNLEDALSSIRR